MPRKPSAMLSYKLRIREVLRRRIEAAAKKRGVSANYEMASRLERSFEKEAQQSNEETAGHIRDAWQRLDGIFHELNKQGDLIRAVEALLKQIEQPGSSAAIEKAVAKVRQAIGLIEQEGARLPSRMHTTGGDQ